MMLKLIVRKYLKNKRGSRIKTQIEVINKKFKDGVPVSVILQNQPTKLDRKRMIGDYEKLRKNEYYQLMIIVMTMVFRVGFI